MKEPVVVGPNFRSFPSHIFSQASQNVKVKVRVDRSVRRNKFTMNTPLRIEKKKRACSLLNSGPAAPSLFLVIVSSSTATIVALFLDHNRKSNFVTPYDPRDMSKSWVLVSLLKYLKSHVYALLLLIICQKPRNKLRGNAEHVQIFC
jgi:hypothetical protein